MVFLDLLLGCVLAYGFIRGLRNGFFVELASLFSLLLGIFIAIKFSHLLASIIGENVAWSQQTIKVTAFVLTFILVVIAVTLLAKFFTTFANFTGLGIFNKLLGGIFGTIKMAVILSVVLNVFAKVNSGKAFAADETLNKSIFYNPIRKIGAAIFPFVEDWLPEKIT